MYILTILLSLLFSLSAFAQNSDATASHLKLSLISEVSHFEKGKSFKVGVLATPDPDWHIYWSNPGDSGSAPKFDWSSSFNAEISEPEFPIPHKLIIGPLANFGYDTTTLFSFDVQPVSENSNDINLRLDAEFLVCQEECIPANAKLEITIPLSKDGQLIKAETKEQFENSKLQIPVDYPSVALSATQDASNIYVSGNLPPGKNYSENSLKLQFFPEHGLIIKNAAEQQIKSDNGKFEIKISKHTAGNQINNLKGILVSDSGWTQNSNQAQALKVQINEIGIKNDQSRQSSGFSSALILALLGGLILNLMPCVFPVLTIKIFGLLNSSEQTQLSRFMGSISFYFGVLLSFLVLAAIIVTGRQAGESLGWGFQLQSPIFVAALALLTFVLALNFLGVFEVGASVQNIALRKHNFYKKGFSKNITYFMDGILVTALATPCTAPFMGSAMAYGLSAPLIELIAVFSALATGVALPFAILNFMPKLAKVLPKPGAWMLILKKLLAFPLLATSIWLLWVYGLQTSVSQLSVFLACLLLVALAFFLYGQFAGPQSKIIHRRILAFLILLSLIVSAIAIKITGATVDKSDAIDWQPYSTAKLQELRSKGQTIYVDFTAAWCITCQVNKIVAFGNNEVQKKIQELNIATLKADWTNKDPEITEAIRAFNREGVPLNVIYPADKNSSPEILPQILTPSIVIEALVRNNK